MKSSSRQLPLPRPWRWPLKSLDSASTTLQQLTDGRLQLTIVHDIVRGVTPAMLVWWFNHIDKEMVVDGISYPRYLLWHPRDHIAYQVVRRAPDGSVGAGARVRIVEAFGRNPGYRVDGVETVVRLDESGLTLTRSLGSTEVFRLAHDFQPVAGGTRYLSKMLVGAGSGLTRSLFNGVLRPRLFPNEMGQAWLRHNIEEVGNFEHFLPELYAQSAVMT